MKKSFFYFMVAFPIFLILIIASSIIYIDGQKFNTVSKYYEQHISKDFINDNKKEIKDKVEFINNIIDFEAKQIESSLKIELNSMIDLSYQMIDDIYKHNKDKLTKEQIRQKAIENISMLKYNGNRGYFYMVDFTKEIMLWHPLKSYRGKDVSKSVDLKGNNRTDILKASLKDDKFGYAIIYFHKNDITKEYPKLSVVFHYKPLDILVGTGEYLDFMESRLKKKVVQRVELLNKNQMTANIKLIEFDKEKDSLDCVIDTASCKYLINETNYPLTLKKLLKQNTKGYIEFKDDEDKRFIYYLYYKDWNWIIQSEFFENDMMYSLNTLQNYIKDDENKIFKNNLFIIFFFMLVSLVASYVVLNKLKNITIKYTDEINNQKDELEVIFKTIKDGIAILDLETNFLYFNESYQKMLGYEKEELLSLKCLGITLPEDIKKVKEAIQKTKLEGSVENFEKIYLVKGGRRVSVNMSIALLPDKQRFLISIKDITEAKAKEKKLHNYISLIDKNIITSTTDVEGYITQASEAFAKISGYTKDELKGKKHNIVKHPDTPMEVFKDLWETISKDEVWSGELKNLKKDGGYYWVNVTISPNFDEYGKKIGYTAIRQDITDKKIIEEISITDGLTKIYNRRHFENIVPKVINSGKRKNDLIAFAIMDIDFFKQYNDTYGHQEGDEVLINVAKTLNDSLNRADDYCFRLGGEEFGVIFKTETKEKAIEFANSLRESIEKLKIKHEKSSVSEYVTISIGLICDFASSIKNKDLLYKEGDDLLYEAKESGRNKVCVKEG